MIENFPQMGTDALIGGGLAFLINKVNGIERRIDALCTANGVDIPARRKRRRASIMLLALALAVLAHCVGCKVTTFRYTDPHGASVVATDSRFLVNTKATIHFTKGTNFSLAVKSALNPDNEALKAIAEGAVKGAKGL